ncbi:MAG: hypothetical protein AB7Q81_15005 [Gammaproteobacteria bacterium]
MSLPLPRPRVRTALLLLGFVTALRAPTAPAAEPVAGAALAGHWQFDEARSDDVEDAFEGKLKRSRYPTPGGMVREGERPNNQDIQQMNYWDAIRDSRERRSQKDLSRLGTVYPLLTATRLDIARAEAGYTFTYDALLPRRVLPNPNGRVYSAKGDELVADTIGYTLSYWEGETLVLETDPPDGGRYIEHVTRRDDPPRLEYRVKVSLIILEEPIEVTRVYVGADGPAD